MSVNIKKLKDRNGDYTGGYLGDDGRYYHVDELFDADDNKLFEFTIVEMSESEVDDCASRAVTVEAENKLGALRKQRDRLIAETDYWGLSDTPAMTQAQQDYRQALRDITDNYTGLDDVVWPTKP